MRTEKRIQEQLNRLLDLDKNMPGLFMDMSEVRMAIRIFRWVLEEEDEGDEPDS